MDFEKDNKKFVKIAKKYRLKLLIAFGSRVSGKTHPMSDFDFGFIPEKEMSYTEEGGLLEDLKQVVKSGKADTADITKVDSFMKHEILKCNRVLYEKKGIYSQYFMDSLREYFDSERLFRTQEAAIEKRLEIIKSSL